MVSCLWKIDSSFIWIQGKISVEDIKRIAKELGEHFSDKEIHDMIEEADRDRKLTSLFDSWYKYPMIFYFSNLFQVIIYFDVIHIYFLVPYFGISC